jgi:hypothetical protein
MTSRTTEITKKYNLKVACLVRTKVGKVVHSNDHGIDDASYYSKQHLNPLRNGTSVS